MREIKLINCKVGDYLYIKTKKGNLRYLDIVTKIKQDSIFVKFTDINNKKEISKEQPIFSNYEYDVFEIKRLNRMKKGIKFFKLNEEEIEKVKLQLIEMKI